MMLAMYMALIVEEKDKEKFDKLYCTYRNMMMKLANSVLHNTSLAEETVQDCLLKLALTITEVPDIPSKRARAMITIMVKNKAKNNLKLEHYNDVTPVEDDDFLSESLADNVASAVGYERMFQFIKELEDIYRDILIFKYILGFGTNDISEFLQIPLRTVETRIYRGKKILKEKMESVFYEYGVRK